MRLKLTSLEKEAGHMVLLGAGLVGGKLLSVATFSQTMKEMTFKFSSVKRHDQSFLSFAVDGQLKTTTTNHVNAYNPACSCSAGVELAAELKFYFPKLQVTLTDRAPCVLPVLPKDAQAPPRSMCCFLGGQGSWFEKAACKGSCEMMCREKIVFLLKRREGWKKIFVLQIDNCIILLGLWFLFSIVFVFLSGGVHVTLLIRPSGLCPWLVAGARCRASLGRRVANGSRSLAEGTGHQRSSGRNMAKPFKS